MIFNLGCTCISQPILRFSLNHFINKVSCFNAPSSWDFTFLDLNLFGKYMVSDFFSRLSYIRSSSKHAFVGHYSYCKIINRSSVILSTHYFWGHVAWCSRGVLSILWPPYSSNSEICDPHITIIVNDQVFWFNIPMNNLLFMAVLESCD